MEDENSRLAILEVKTDIMSRDIGTLSCKVEGIYELKNSIALLTSAVQVLGNKVDALEQIPKSRYNDIVKTVISVGIGGVIGFILKQIGIV